MITIRDWIPTIPDEDKHIAYVGEGQSVEKEFFVTGEGWEKFRDWTYHLDMAFDLAGVTACDSREVTLVKEDGTVSEPDQQNRITSKTTTTETYTVNTVTAEPYAATDIAYLHKEIGAEGLRLRWTVLRQHTQLAGKLTANLRAVGPDEEIKKSALMVFEVDPSVSAVPAAAPTESEFEQMEQRMGQMCEELRALQMDMADSAAAVNTRALEVQQSAIQAQHYATAAADKADDADASAQDAADSAALAQTAAADANTALLQCQKQVSSARTQAETAKQAVNDAKKYGNQAAGHATTAKEQATAAQSSATTATVAAQNAASSAQAASDDLATVRQNATAAQGQLAAAQKAAEDAAAAATAALNSANTASGSCRQADEAARSLMGAMERIPPEFGRSDIYYILRVNHSGDGLEFVNIAQDMYIQTWVVPYLLPAVDSSHNGMVLKVVNGQWTAASP